jgi:hypothetical protein
MPAIPEEQTAPPAHNTSSRETEQQTPPQAEESTASPAPATPAAPAAEEEPGQQASRPTMPTIDETAAQDETPAAKAEPAPAPAPTPPRKKGRKARPSVPSWEDVLLGTRSNR